MSAFDGSRAGRERKERDMSEEIKDQQAPAPKKSKKKLGIIAGVVAAVIVVAGAGFWVWHETPGFCGAICHTPMDPYLATYEEEPAEGAMDKYGNTVDGSTMLAAVHRVDGEATCLSCHEPTLSQQIGEGIAWVTGGYEAVENATYGAVITERSTSQLTEALGKNYDEFCLNEACHELLDREGLGKMTSHLPYNYHDQSAAPHGEIAECGDCHKAHTQSVVKCSQCHTVDVPEGWLTYDEAKQLVSA